MIKSKKELAAERRATLEAKKQLEEFATSQKAMSPVAPDEDRISDLEGKLNALILYLNKLMFNDCPIRFRCVPKDTWVVEEAGDVNPCSLR